MTDAIQNGEVGSSVRAKLNENFVDVAALKAEAALSFDTVASLLADSTLTYVTAPAGTIVEAGGFRYEVAASAATDQHVSTVGGVKLYVLTGDGGVSIDAFGAVGDGVADETAVIIKAMQFGGDVYVNQGTYRIAGTGPNSGGAHASITKSLRVQCHPSARFVADGLDNDMILLFVPSDGAGLPADGITVDWVGGYFDQSNQKVSTVVPFAAEYPPPTGKVGTSATCDGLSIRGYYTVASVEYFGIKRAIVSGVTTSGGSHWQSAGGDSGIFIGGCEEQTVRDCTNIGNRDLGIYMSSSDDLQSRSILQNNLHVNCFHGSAIKRAADYSQIVGNHVENCPRAYLIEEPTGATQNCVTVSGNTANSCGIFVRVSICDNFNVSDNNFTNLGAFLEDGTTIEPLGGSYGIGTSGTCTMGIVANNTLLGLSAGYAAVYPTGGAGLLTSAATSRVKFHNNACRAYRVLGSDTGTSNIFIDNVNYDFVTSANLSALGSGSFEQRRSPTTNTPDFRQPVAFADGSAALPTIIRSGQPNTGIYFATNQVRFVAGGDDRLIVGQTSMGFRGTAVAFPTWVAATGTASRATFDTTTVTTAQLAERVKALIDDLRAYGLFV